MCNPITYSDIERYQRVSRNLALSEGEIYTAKYSAKHFDEATTGDIRSIKEFMNECTGSVDRAIDYAIPCLEFVERHNDDKELVSMWKNSILPKVDTYTVGHLLEMTEVKKIKDILSREHVVRLIGERVLTNHQHISKRVDLEQFLVHVSVNLEQFYLEVASAVNTFSMPTYAKFNCSIEESSYLLQKHGIEHDQKDMLRYLNQYYRLSEQLTDEEKGQMDKVVNDSYFIVRDEDRAYMQTRSMIQRACMKFENEYEYDNSAVAFGSLIASIASASSVDLSNNFKYFLDLITSLIVAREDKKDDLLIEYILSEGLTLATNSINRGIQERLTEDDCVEVYDNLTKQIDARISGNDTLSARHSFIHKYNSRLIQMKDVFNTLKGIAYPAYNLKSMQETSLVEGEEPTQLALNEFRIFKFDNLITRLWKADKYLQRKFTNWKNKTIMKWKWKKFKSRVFKEMAPFDTLTADGDIDCSIASIDYTPGDDIREAHQELNVACMVLNNEVFNESEFKAYYLIHPDHVDIRVRCTDGTIVESALARKLTDDELDAAANIMVVAEAIDPDYNLIDSAVSYFCENPDPEAFDVFVDACEVAGVDKDTVVDIFESIKINIPLQESIGITSLRYHRITNYQVIEEAEAMDRAVAYMILQAMTEDVKKPNLNKGFNKDKDVKKPDVKDDKQPEKEKKEVKNPFKGVNLNNMKIAIHGLRGKLKDADTKVKTAVTNMDYAVERLIQSMKKAMISDRRESIIKGSVIPSFHKCIMIAVGEAALWMVNPVFAIIAAVGGLAASKKLTKKERALLLDDIEVELRIVEKEIQNAESRNQIKKMRSLMKIQKDLQRTYQRIRFNMSAGKDLIPSNVGTPSDRY